MNDMSNIIVTTYFIYHARGKVHRKTFLEVFNETYDKINHFKNLIIPRLIEMQKNEHSYICKYWEMYVNKYFTVYVQGMT